MGTNAMRMLDHALEYLALGWSIFPVEVPVLGDKDSGKAPLIPSWQRYQKRPPTDEQVRAWWARWPDAGIAVVCGRVSSLVVVDVDPQHGGTGEGLPNTGRVVKTGGGGAHYYYAYPEDYEGRIANQVNVDGTGMDVRADGGYVIAPPSLHYSGGSYEWAYVSSVEALALPPDWAVTPPEKPEPESKGNEKWLTSLLTNGAPVGERNKSLVRMAGYYASLSLPQDSALALCRQWNGSLESPMPRSEVDVTVRSAYKMERRKTDKPKQFTGLKVLSIDEYMLKHGSGETEWLVQDWMPRDTIVFVISPPQTFKTWVIFDLACSIASGQPFLGRYPVHGPGPVVLFQQEDAHMSIAQRTALIGTVRLGRDFPSMDDDVITIPTITQADLPLYYHEERKLRFDDEEVMDALEEVIQQLRPKAVIVDPLYSAADTDEYMAKAAQHMLRLKDMRDTYGCSFVVVHHTRKTMDTWDRQQLWGSQFINAFIETSWMMRKPPIAENRDAVVLRHTKADGPLPFAHLQFDINTKTHPWRYAVESRSINEAQADDIVKGKGLTEEERPNALEDAAVELLKVHGPLPEEDIASSLARTKTEVRKLMRGLLHKHRVKQDALQRWELLDPAFK